MVTNPEGLCLQAAVEQLSLHPSSRDAPHSKQRQQEQQQQQQQQKTDGCIESSGWPSLAAGLEKQVHDADRLLEPEAQQAPGAGSEPAAVSGSSAPTARAGATDGCLVGVSLGISPVQDPELARALLRWLVAQGYRDVVVVVADTIAQFNEHVFRHWALSTGAAQRAAERAGTALAAALEEAAADVLREQQQQQGSCSSSTVGTFSNGIHDAADKDGAADAGGGACDGSKEASGGTPLPLVTASVCADCSGGASAADLLSAPLSPPPPPLQTISIRPSLHQQPLKQQQPDGDSHGSQQQQQQQQQLRIRVLRWRDIHDDAYDEMVGRVWREYENDGSFRERMHRIAAAILATRRRNSTPERLELLSRYVAWELPLLTRGLPGHPDAVYPRYRKAGADGSPDWAHACACPRCASSASDAASARAALLAQMAGERAVSRASLASRFDSVSSSSGGGRGGGSDGGSFTADGADRGPFAAAAAAAAGAAARTSAAAGASPTASPLAASRPASFTAGPGSASPSRPLPLPPPSLRGGSSARRQSWASSTPTWASPLAGSPLLASAGSAGGGAAAGGGGPLVAQRSASSWVLQRRCSGGGGRGEGLVPDEMVHRLAVDVLEGRLYPGVTAALGLPPGCSGARDGGAGQQQRTRRFVHALFPAPAPSSGSGVGNGECGGDGDGDRDAPWEDAIPEAIFLDC